MDNEDIFFVFWNPKGSSLTIPIFRGGATRGEVTQAIVERNKAQLNEKQTGTGGNLAIDAHIAALALECGCGVYSADNDFRRFPGLRHINPLAA